MDLDGYVGSLGLKKLKDEIDLLLNQRHSDPHDWVESASGEQRCRTCTVQLRSRLQTISEFAEVVLMSLPPLADEH